MGSDPLLGKQAKAAQPIQTMALSTPRGEDAERLDYWYDRCDELHWMRRANQIEDELYHKLSEALENEGVGEYHRALCDPSFTTRPKRHLNPLLRGLPLKLEKLLPPKAGKPIVVKFQPCKLYSQRSHHYRI